MHGVLMFAVMALGLLWRSHLVNLPPPVAKYGGDALWALLVFLGLGCCFPKSPTWRLACAALGFAWSVEFSQLYHAAWIDAVRATRIGALVLGSTFNLPDLPAYLLGVMCGACAENIGFRARRRFGGSA